MEEYAREPWYAPGLFDFKKTAVKAIGCVASVKVDRTFRIVDLSWF